MSTQNQTTTEPATETHPDTNLPITEPLPSTHAHTQPPRKKSIFGKVGSKMSGLAIQAFTGYTQSNDMINPYVSQPDPFSRRLSARRNSASIEEKVKYSKEVAEGKRTG
jgi:hypothetical protein